MTRALTADEIFSVDENSFDNACLNTFQYQYNTNRVYRQFSDLLGKTPGKVNKIQDIPFLPVQFFKTHRVLCGDNYVKAFESSGTTGDIPSRHYVKDLSLYERSFVEGFKRMYGEPGSWVILALLPSYLERGNSSLVYMAEKLINLSENHISRFVLNKHEELAGILYDLSVNKTRTMLLGVTFALLDHAEKYPSSLGEVVIMETGGMKGRREELTRAQVHERLKKAFNVKAIHSEYGMTELLSQAYSEKDGIFITPPWMKIAARATDDPQMITFATGKPISGGTNIIDLANQHSCSFIATDDLCMLHPRGSFEITGRIDNCDIRGCSLMTA